MPENKPNYRKPAVLQALNGDLMLFAEKRNDGNSGIGDHDHVLKQSRDNGMTWNSEQIIFDDGDRTSTDVTAGFSPSTARLPLGSKP
jgi:sialidase-1